MTEGEVKQWPDLVGKDGEEAVEHIKKSHPELNVIKLPKDSRVTRDYRIDRVRVFVDADNKVHSVPKTG